MPRRYSISSPDPREVRLLIGELRKRIDRLEALFVPTALGDEAADLDPGSPRNKNGRNLTPRGIEVAYRLFDAGKTRFAVAAALGVSFAAADHRHRTWLEAGGADRERKPLV